MQMENGWMWSWSHLLDHAPALSATMWDIILGKLPWTSTACLVWTSSLQQKPSRAADISWPTETLLQSELLSQTTALRTMLDDASHGDTEVQSHSLAITNTFSQSQWDPAEFKIITITINYRSVVGQMSMTWSHNSKMPNHMATDFAMPVGAMQSPLQVHQSGVSIS